jgi:hypothetical protein
MTVTFRRKSTSIRIIGLILLSASSGRPGLVSRAFPFEALVLLPGSRSSSLNKKDLRLYSGASDAEFSRQRGKKRPGRGSDTLDRRQAA